MASKAATAAVDFTRIYSTLGLGKETVAALQAFRKRHSDAQRITGQLNAQPTTVDVAHYRTVLKNKAIVDEAEKILRDFKPVTYDVGAHVKVIETFETKAVRHISFIHFWLTSIIITCHSVLHPFFAFLAAIFVSQIAKAKETEAQIDVELNDLQATLSNIQDARSFEDLTTVENMMKKGKWTVPGYREKFGDLSLM
ncbi:ATP synthase d subunit [Lactifluus volemus]|nr:ATP synthase d subunit [Lactifluus volemus]